MNDITEFQKSLVRGFFKYAASLATREEIKNINYALENFSYISFYPYGMPDISCIFIAFSASSNTVALGNNSAVTDVVCTNDDFCFYLNSRMAHVMYEHIKISTKTVLRHFNLFDIEKLSAKECFYSLPTQSKMNPELLYPSIMQFVKNEDYFTDEEQNSLDNFFRSCDNISIDLVKQFNEEKYTHGVPKLIPYRNSLIKFNSNIVGMVSESGEFFERKQVVCTDVNMWIQMLMFIVSQTSIKISNLPGVQVLDENEDCDSLICVPGKLSSVAVHNKYPWEN